MNCEKCAGFIHRDFCHLNADKINGKLVGSSKNDLFILLHEIAGNRFSCSLNYRGRLFDSYDYSDYVDD